MSVVGEAIIKLVYDGKSAVMSLAKAEEGQKSALQKMASGAKTTGKVIGAGLVAGYQLTKGAIEGVTAVALKSYAEFEQLAGGIETLYGKSSDKMMENAQKAFQTAGLSANEYMETATSFAASLVQSLGGNTEKAAKYADSAIQDMSDNANKMGTSMESIQNAYQGFAKQNYSMLDNLKLGYGGTKKEMERLLEDAEKISGKSFDIDSYADVTQAIHVIQKEMKITGTTAKEAGSTIQGSFTSMKAAATNLMTGLADPKADMNKLIDNLVNSIFGDGKKNKGVLGNAMPVIQRIITGIAKALPKLIQELSAKLPDFLKEIIPPLADATVQAFVAIMDMLPQILPLIVDGLVQMVVALVPYIPTILGALFKAIILSLAQLFDSLFTALGPWLESVAQSIWQWFLGLENRISAFFGDFAEGVVNAVGNFVNGFKQGIQKVKDWFAGIPAFFSGIFQKIVGLFKGIGTKIGEVVSGAFKGVVNGVLSFIEGFLNTPIDAINGLIDVINEVPGVDIPTLNRINLPRLAKGGLITGSTIANIGEAGDEAVIPLERNTENWAQPLASAIAEQFREQNVAGAGVTVYMTNNINNNLDADEIGQRLMTSIRRAS